MKSKDLNIVAVIGVRMGSSRLPGKVMKKIMGKPVLGYLIERVKRSKLIDNLVIATSLNSENDVIESFCDKIEIPCFRGSENDVMDRILNALLSRDADVGVEIFGDCPLIDPDIIDIIVRF